MDSPAIEKPDLPLVSFVLTSWNRCEELIEVVEHIKRQCYPNYEIVVVDNHSTDDLPVVLPQQYPEINYIRLDYNSGSWAGRDIAMQHARGKYICSLDDDSFPGVESIERAVSVFEEDESVGLIAMDIYDYDFYFSEQGRDTLSIPMDEGYPVSAFIACGAIFRAKLLQEVGGWEHWFAGGVELSFSIRVLDAGYAIRQFKGIYVYHKEVKKSRPNRLRMEHMAKNPFVLYWTYHTLLENIPWTIKMVFDAVLSDLLQRQLLRTRGFVRAVLEGRQKKYPIRPAVKEQVRIPTQQNGRVIPCEDSTEVLKRAPVSSILLLRTLPMQRLPLMVSLLREKFPGARIEVLTHPTTSRLFEEIDDIATVHYYEAATNFCHQGLSGEQRGHFSSFDLMVFGSFEDKIIGRYLNIQELSRKLSVPLLAGLHESGKMIQYRAADLNRVTKYRAVALLGTAVLFLLCAPIYLFKRRSQYYFSYNPDKKPEGRPAVSAS